MNTQAILKRLQTKIEGVQRVMEMIHHISLGKPYKFSVRLINDKTARHYTGSCVGIPVGYNQESLSLKVICSDMGYPVTGYNGKLYIRNQFDSISINFKRIVECVEFVDDPLLCMRYPIRTQLLEDMLKEGRDGQVTEQKGSY